MPSSFLIWRQWFEQLDEVAIGSPFSLVVRFFVEAFEHIDFTWAPLKLSHFVINVEDTFLIWSMARFNWWNSLIPCTILHSSIRFALSTKNQSKLPFLDLSVYRKGDGSVGQSIENPPTPIFTFILPVIPPPPPKKKSVLSTLVYLAQAISGKDSLTAELCHLQKGCHLVSSIQIRYQQTLC